MISTEELAGILDDLNLRVIDCSVAMGRQQGDDHRINYLKNPSIKGAIFIDMDYFRDMKADFPYMLPSEKQFIDTMKRHNIKMTNRVVCYDSSAAPGFFSYRVAWMLEAFGHKNVQVLNGGLTKWLAEGRPT